MANEVRHQRPPERQFWYMKTPEGSVYGPTAWEQLRAWVEQGRVTADCELAPGEGRDWQRAGDVFAELQPKPAIPVPLAQPVETQRDASLQHPVVARSPSATVRIELPPVEDAEPFRKHHRGGLILVLGAIGLLVACPIFSLTAWVMGSDDLRAMDAGEMDPAGRSHTLIGQRLGMALSLVWIVGCMITLFVMLVAGYRG